MENSSAIPEQINLQTEDVLASDISDNTSNFDDILMKEISSLNESQPDKEKAITHNSITGIDHSSTQVQKTESSTTSLSQNIVNDDMDEALDFVEMKHKEHVSKATMKRIRRKKLQDQNSSLDISSDNNLSCDSESKSPTNVSFNQRHEVLCFTKIPYNQKKQFYQNLIALRHKVSLIYLG
ncbi:4086_t:CDS:2 [Ambispora gerdemannii]|uniref:4086_t:CDS:1 n=1 Tax=Ambispora gerdemannii TaxID=144530 RepID=A0A9N9E672_9GLOM|nr:4086_t:CDS:2 [Ambispora gerdemannii]